MLGAVIDYNVRSTPIPWCFKQRIVTIYYIIMRRPENKIGETTSQADCCIKNTCEHMFSLKARASGLYYHQPTLVSFCPQYCRESISFKKAVPESHFDGKPHFPLFMLGIDRENTIKRQKQYLQAHKNRVLNLETSAKDIFVPHPGQAKTTCFVCKASYTDYRKHILTKKHKRKLNSSRMEPSINELIEIVSKEYGSQTREEILNMCSSEFSRMGSSKTEDSQTNVFLKPLKKCLKQIKGRNGERSKFQTVWPELAQQREMGETENKVEASINKVEDYRTTTINFLSPNSQFRVEDYLM